MLKSAYEVLEQSLNDRKPESCYLLRQTTVVQEYLTLLKRFIDQLIIIAVKDTSGFQFNEILHRKMCELGLRINLVGKHWHGYLAVIDEGVVTTEKLGEKNECVQETLKLNDSLSVEVISRPYNSGNEAIIRINDINYAINQRGINIVVYDKKDLYMVDSVCFDTHEKLMPCQRSPLKQMTLNQSIERSDKIKDIAALKERLKISNIIPESIV